MAGWIETRVHVLKTEVSGTAEADEGGAELVS